MISVDVSKHQRLATEQGLSSVPTKKFYTGKQNVADYKGARTQAEMASWIYARLLPIKLTYSSPEWARFTQTPYALPHRFIYIYEDGATPDTSALYDAVKQRGVFATAAIPANTVSAFLKSYDIKALPVLVKAVSGRLTVVPSNNLDAVVTETVTDKTVGKTFGTGFESDSHSTFTFFFFLIGIIGIGVFAWRKISFPKRQHDAMKTV